MSFPTTQWDLIAAATLNGNREGREALNALCSVYRAPVLAFFRSRMASLEDAQDMTQRLFERLLEGRIWKRADASKGRFRNYLLTIAANVLRNYEKAATTLKRHPGAAPLSLDLLDDTNWEPTATDDAAAMAFDREWARSALTAAWNRLEQSAAATAEKSDRFTVLRRFLPGREKPPSYEEAAATLGIGVDRLRTFIYRLRNDFREALRAEVARTVASPDDLAAEMDHLHSVMIAGIRSGANGASETL